MIPISHSSPTIRKTLSLNRYALVRLSLLVSLVVLACAPLLLRAQTPHRSYEVDSTLLLLRELRQRADTPPRLRKLLDSSKIGVSIRFRSGRLLAAPNLAQMETELGIEFTQLNGKVSRVGTVCGARAPWDALDRLAMWPGVERVDSTWKPAVAAPLDVSIDQIRADDVWEMLDEGGWPVSGRGIVVANFDTGVDVFHPDLWRTGGTYPWLDVNDNGLFDPGVDAVDLDRNSSAEASERLELLNSGTAPWSDRISGTDNSLYYLALDWLYNDANSSGVRDYGPASGFAETDPSYGERLFVAEDTNDNGVLDIGEVLLSLDTSKVQKTLDASGVERTRGVDLITNLPDENENGHGTQVSSVLCGGSIEFRRYVGVAPGITLLVADRYGNDYTTYVPWAESNGAQIMLYEFGSWIQEFMDGSSNLEQMLDVEAAKGIVQVVPAGNLADGQKHAHLILSTVKAHDLRFQVPYGQEIRDVWLSILWPAQEEAVGLQLTTPLGSSATLLGDGSWVNVDGHSIWSYRERSMRGTSRFDIYMDHSGAAVAEGDWTLWLHNDTLPGLNVNAYVWDADHRWTDGVVFLDHLDNMYTVTSPATADSAITVTSYSTRGRQTSDPGALSSFSGQGPRIDNEPILDLAAPGHYDIACASSKDVAGATLGQYAWFGGTSAAAPHVAGAVALLLQIEPGLSPAQVKARLRDNAREDAFTGLLPNFRWGWGKLDIGAALSAPPKPSPTPRTKIFLPVVLKAPTPQNAQQSGTLQS